MTYCLGIINRFGIVMGADSRTNAGVDYISAYRKLFDFSVSGERVIMVCTSGNLSISQGVIHELKRDLHNQEDKNLHSLTHLYDIAHYIGDKSRQVQARERTWLEQDNIDFQCNFILGGQINNVWIGSNSNMTIESCLNLCRGFSLPYAGLEFS